MAKAPKVIVDDSSIPNRMVIDFLEGTLRKKDAIAFARGFIEHHFDSLTASGYFVMPYEQGYIFEAQEGGPQRAYLPNIMKALDDDPATSACVQMARRIMEVKRSQSGTYTAVLLPEGTESQNEDIAFPPPGPKLLPFQRSGMTMLYTGISFAAMGLIVFILSLLFWLVEITGLMSPTLRTINLGALPLTQWQALEAMGGEKSDNYVKTLRFQNNAWQEDKAARQEYHGATTTGMGTAPDLAGLPPGVQPAGTRPGQPAPGQAATATPPAVAQPAAAGGGALTTPANNGLNPAAQRPMTGNPMAGNPLPGNPMPGNPLPGNPMPGGPMPGNPLQAAHPMPAPGGLPTPAPTPAPH